MNLDETERKISFIVQQQAQFNADMMKLRESQAQTDQVVARLAYVTLEGFKDVNAKIDALVDSQIQLSDAQKHTDQRLNAKIDRLVDSQTQLSEEQRNSHQAVNAKIDRLVDSQIQLTEAQKRTDHGLALTDERLRKLIDKVDRGSSDKSNGSGSG